MTVHPPEFFLPHDAAQQAFGAALARSAPTRALVFLDGDLGAGKTTLVRGYLRELGYVGAVRSPTYTLIEPYASGGASVWHLDLYRLGDAEELEYLGLRDLLAEDAVLLIEWPERGAGWLPEPDLRVQLQVHDCGRQARLEPKTKTGLSWVHRLQF